MRTLARLIVPVLLAATFVPSLAAQTTDDVRFAAPVRLKAGQAFLGEKRYYPSPAVHDVNGDGVMDVVIGDLPGTVTVAYGKKGEDGALVLGAETAMLTEDGEKLNFHNW